MIVLDGLAKDFYEYFYSDMNSLDVYNFANNMISKTDKELLTIGINVFRTAATLGMSFESYHAEAAIRLQYIVNDLNLFVFNIAFCEIYNLEYQILEKFFGYKFKRGPAVADISEVQWDHWFYNMCLAVGANSKCFSRKIGAVLVRDRSVIGTGYNGPPRKIPHCDRRYKMDTDLRAELKSMDINPDSPQIKQMCPRHVMGQKSGEGLQWCIAGHAERNAINNSARAGISTKDCILYMDCGIPCVQCLSSIINAGISEIVITKILFYDSASKYVLENSNLKYRLFSHLLPGEKNDEY